MKKFLALSALLVCNPGTFVLGIFPIRGQGQVGATRGATELPRPLPTPTARLADISFAMATRGGSSSPISLDLASAILVQVFGAMSALHGVILAVVPTVGKGLMGHVGDEASSDDPAQAYAEEAIGVHSIEYGLTGYLAATGLTTPERAIGYGMLPDLFFLGKNLVNGNFRAFGVQKLMMVLTSVAAVCTAAILTDSLHYGPILEFLTIVPIAQGLPKYLDPVSSGKKMLGTDLSDKPVTKSLYRLSGQAKIVSAVLRGCIAFGVAPIKALGYAAVADSVMVIDSIVRKTTEGIENKRALYHQIGSLALSLTMSAVFLLKGV